MKKPIAIIVIIHNDLQDYSRDTLYKDYFSWLITELEDISGRPVFIHFPEKDEVTQYSDYQYNKYADADAALEDWMDMIADFHFALQRQKSFHNDLVKILLLTRYNIDDQQGIVGGIAYEKGFAAIAAITSTHIAAHEIGHMLGAKHENSVIHYNHGWQDSIMLSEDNHLRTSSHLFSDKNRQNIRDYLNTLP